MKDDRKGLTAEFVEAAEASGFTYHTDGRVPPSDPTMKDDLDQAIRTLMDKTDAG